MNFAGCAHGVFGRDNRRLTCMSKQTNAVAKAQQNLPAEAEGFEEYAGAGMENATSDDFMIPRLGILQQLSPQLKSRDAAYIEGAEEGMVADLGTGELFQDGVIFLPVHFSKVWIEWAPRSSGKGIADIHRTGDILDTCSRDEKNRPFTPDGNLIAETSQWFGLNLSAGGRWCFIPMTSTQLKKSRRWMTLTNGERLQRSDGTEFVAPLFYRTYKLGAALESNNEGEWFGWTLARDKALPELGDRWRNIKEQAIAFRESIVAGEATADLSSMDERGHGEEAM